MHIIIVQNSVLSFSSGSCDPLPFPPPSVTELPGAEWETPFQSGPSSFVEWGGFVFFMALCAWMRVRRMVRADTSLVKVGQRPFSDIRSTVMFGGLL